MAVELSMSVCNYDRTAALFDGRAPVEGCDVTAVALEPEESFHRAFKFQEFDVTEISMSSYLLSRRAATTRTTSPFRPSCRGCSGTPASTSAPIAASRRRRT